MTSFLPTTKVFAALAGAAFLMFNLFTALAVNMLNPDPPTALRLGVPALFVISSVLLIYSLTPLMVRAVFHLAVKVGMLAPTAWLASRAITDRIVVGIWGVETLGLLTAALLPLLKSRL